MNLIRAELYRISRKKILYISFVSLICLALFFCKSSKAEETETIIKTALTYGTAVIPIMFILVYLQVWQADFSSRCINNILISGMSRIYYYFGKLVLMNLLGGILAFVYALGVLVFSYFFKGEFLISEFLPAIAIQIFLYFVVMTIGLMIYIVVDSPAVSTAVYLLFVLLFENLISELMKQVNINIEKISSYLIMQNLSKAVSVINMRRNEIYLLVVSGIVLWIVSISISILLLKEREYK